MDRLQEYITEKEKQPLAELSPEDKKLLAAAYAERRALLSDEIKAASKQPFVVIFCYTTVQFLMKFPLFI
jgi:hypothetical protein